jgi:hypothetical protein
MDDYTWSEFEALLMTEQEVTQMRLNLPPKLRRKRGTIGILQHWRARLVLTGLQAPPFESKPDIRFMFWSYSYGAT